jgi:hypothetical protein
MGYDSNLENVFLVGIVSDVLIHRVTKAVRSVSLLKHIYILVNCVVNTCGSVV